MSAQDGVILEPEDTETTSAEFTVFLASLQARESAQHAGFAADLHDKLVELRKERDLWEGVAMAWIEADEALARARAISNAVMFK